MYNCCDIPEPTCKKLSLSKKKKTEKPKPLCLSAHFTTTVSSEGIEKSKSVVGPAKTIKLSGQAHRYVHIPSIHVLFLNIMNHDSGSQ